MILYFLDVVHSFVFQSIPNDPVSVSIGFVLFPISALKFPIAIVEASYILL